ncbi:MAG: DUF445 domain-containing protein [Fusobacterium varium]|jgi:uncharacterized membrane protein YheB (UPF0754 family)|uniref:DUF445 domain-containing protein n=1 Tax=Fusobacterium varium ATCC 27725 TaxID=469618 RepID=A0ABN5JG41_FUSVA|nr:MULTISPECIES: DUF445 family protein [Fusobacterium]AVQ31012.1 DUF445 domain-containing protein [Fusobacterium varium ATCC 27725]EES62330.1 hypothetical protein FVAG_00019 [Fusobacterium varium ATCC 27725]MCI6031631.1 DUF445 family protein [Fusobacterium varium]MDY4005751.1 DUF445 family protein [Fusobacterium varium]OFL90844.1 hypothetical protein HMPREF2747_01200 [Fusobacterium sp. HMSC073F01]
MTELNTMLIKLALIVGIGAMIGWITNYVAIKMLFRPYKEINFGLFKIQGLIPKRKHEIAISIADTVQKELISLKDVTSTLDGEELEARMGNMIDKILDEKLEGELTKKFPMLAMFMSEDMLKKIKNMIKTSILENKDTIIEMFSNYLEEKVSFRDIIITNVDGFSLEKLEDITYSLAKKELKHIEVVGAILGGIIGFFQFGVSLFM